MLSKYCCISMSAESDLLTPYEMDTLQQSLSLDGKEKQDTIS
jgi:hypothetical protein